MRREERIAYAKRITAATQAERARRREQEAKDREARLAALSSDEARHEALKIAQAESAEVMGPDKTPGVWDSARRAIRDAAIAAAMRRRTLTYAEIQLVAYEATGLVLGGFLTGRMCGEVNRKDDGCMLSSIIVSNETGRPGSGFEPFARSWGFTDPLPTLQRQVFEHFAGEVG